MVDETNAKVISMYFLLFVLKSSENRLSSPTLARSNFELKKDRF